MCLHYMTPVLLIEFAEGKNFGFGFSKDVNADTSKSKPSGNRGTQGGFGDGNELNSKLTLLALTFPKLRIVWSSSPSATAEIFEDLKV